MTRFLERFINDENGATAIEYALIACFLAIVIITAVTLVGTRVTAKFTAVGNKLS